MDERINQMPTEITKGTKWNKMIIKKVWVGLRLIEAIQRNKPTM